MASVFSFFFGGGGGGFGVLFWPIKKTYYSELLRDISLFFPDINDGQRSTSQARDRECAKCENSNNGLLTDSAWVGRVGGLTRDGTAEPALPKTNLGRERTGTAGCCSFSSPLTRSREGLATIPFFYAR